MARDIALIGKRFGRLLVTEEAARDERGRVAFHCSCDCGSEVVLCIDSLYRGTKSCGCLRSELAIARNISHTLHGMSDTPTHRSWRGAIQRCTNKNELCYHYYGGRGIKVCDRWLESFNNFYEDMGDKPDGYTLDRIDPNGDYCPENCRWATRHTQSNNRRNNISVVEYASERHTLKEWSKKVGVSYGTLRWRMLKGWPTEAMLFTPTGKE